MNTIIMSILTINDNYCLPARQTETETVWPRKGQFWELPDQKF